MKKKHDRSIIKKRKDYVRVRVFKDLRRRISGINIRLAVLSLIIATALHMYVRSLNENDKGTIVDGNVYLKEQGGSHGKKTHSCRAKKSD